MRNATRLGNADLLFKQDGTVQLPKLTGLAIDICGKTGQCFTRQPTRERAELVMDAVRDRVAAKGLSMEIRPGRKTDTFGVYLVPEDTTKRPHPKVGASAG